MIDADRLAALSEAHAKQRSSLILRLIAALFPIWRSVDNFHDVDQVGNAAAASAFQVNRAQVEARRQFRAYATQTLAEMGVTDPLPPQWDYYPRSGTTILDVWERPAEQGIFGYSLEEAFDQAQERLFKRMQTLAEDDLLLAERDEEQHVYSNMPRVVGYRRIIHPELSRYGTCGLCAVAATQRYKVSELRPLHTNCHCTSAPIIGTEDPGRVLNDSDLRQLYAAAGQARSIGGGMETDRSTAREDLLNVRVTVKENGEKGPVLVKEGDHFRTHSQADAPEFKKPTASEVRSRKERALKKATRDLAKAEDRLIAVRAENPGSTEQVAAAQRIKNLKSLQLSLRTELATAER